MDNLQDLLVDTLKDLYSAENMLVKAMPRMAKATKNEQLREAFEEHLSQTEGQVERLDRIFEMLEASPRGKKCAAMEGLIEESKELIGEKPAPNVLDAGLICAAQKVEHYEIASYGCARTWANQLGLTEVAELLEETLEEEKNTDERLTEIAENMVNLEAEEGEEDEEEAPARGNSRQRGNSKKGGRAARA